MLLPSIFGNDIFDTMMSFPRFDDLGDVDRKLYGKNADRLMKTDVREHEDHFEVDIDLPGFAKDEIKLELNHGYLTISTEKTAEKENKDGRMVRTERYTGSMQRSFYIGDYVTEEDIHASLDSGVLHLTVPKKEARKAPEKHQILIEG